jgi:hypothetical protein
MQFGPPSLKISEPRATRTGLASHRAALARRGVYLRGTHSLVVSAAYWRLDLADGLIVRHTGSTRRLKIAMARLKGEKLEGVSINCRSGMTTFYFDLGARIVARSTAGASKDSEIWSLSSGAWSVSVYAGGSYTSTSVKRSPGKPVPLLPNADGLLVFARTDKLRRAILATRPNAAV